jgi:hypothetical protein
MQNLSTKVMETESGSITLQTDETGVWLFNHGHSTHVDGIRLEETNNEVSVHWGPAIYYYEGLNFTEVLANFTALGSLGKTANFIKKNGELVRKFVLATSEIVRY